MRILHIIGNLNTGGAEKLLVETLPLLNTETDTVADLLLFNGQQTPFVDELIKSGVGVAHLGKGLYNPLFVFKLIPYFRRYEILHVHLFPALYVVVLAKILAFSKIKLIFTEHSTGNRRMTHPLFKHIDKFFYSHYSKVICITTQVKEKLIKNLGISTNKLVIINNGIALKKIQGAKKNTRADYQFDEKDKLLIMVAGFRIEKDQKTVISALAKLPEQYKLILVGDGDHRQACEALTKLLNLEKRVFFYGIRTDIYPLMKMCDMAILSSHWEGFGLSAVESMACGLPTIVSNVPGLADTVGDAGVTFEKGNVVQLVTQIQNIFEDSGFYNRLVEKGKIKASQFGISSMVDAQVKLYENMVSITQ